jgi:hypothetical protein
MRAIALSCLLVLAATASGRGAERFVAAGGRDLRNRCAHAARPCRTLARALAVAASGDVIKVAAGAYRESLRMRGSTSLTILGGWAPGFTTRDPRRQASVVRAPATRRGGVGRERVWAVWAGAGDDLRVTIDGFVLRGGRTTVPLPSDVFDHLADGGGLSALADDGGSLTLTLRNLQVRRNEALSGGGGLSIHALDRGRVEATVENVVVERNQARDGGGLAIALIEGAALRLTLANCLVARNRAATAFADNLDFLGGGGLFVLTEYDAAAPVHVRLQNCTITKNRVGEEVVGRGNVVGSGGGMSVVKPYGGGPITVELVNTIVRRNGVAPLRVNDTLLGASRLGRDLLLFARGQVAVSAAHSAVGGRLLIGGDLRDLGGNVTGDPALGAELELRRGSPLVDTGTCHGVPATDLGGDPRPSGAGCDIGADELAEAGRGSAASAEPAS